MFSAYRMFEEILLWTDIYIKHCASIKNMFFPAHCYSQKKFSSFYFHLSIENIFTKDESKLHISDNFDDFSFLFFSLYMRVNLLTKSCDSSTVVQAEIFLFHCDRFFFYNTKKLCLVGMRISQFRLVFPCSLHLHCLLSMEQ